MLKLDLEKELATELRGWRVSALAIVCSNPSVSFKSLNLQSYEALGCEPMHSISNHIANVLTEELPNLLRGEAKSRFHETRELSLRNKEAKIARDHRVAIILFARRLTGLVTETQQMGHLLHMQRIMTQALACPQIPQHQLPLFVMRSLEFGAIPTSVSARKSHCKPLHNPASHQLIQLRHMSGDSSNTEDEERIFSAVKGIIKSTSNNKALSTCMWSQIYYRDFKLEKKMEVEQAQQQSSRTTSVSLLQKPPTIRQHQVLSCLLDDPRLWRSLQGYFERIQ